MARSARAAGSSSLTWRKILDELERGREPDSPSQHKVAMGLLHGMPMRGDGLLAGWRARVSVFPDVLARSMAKHHLRVFPYWLAARRLARRDARLFELQSLLDGAFHVVGALSAANGLYFTTFQFKRMRAYIAGVTNAPTNLADRLESLFTPPSEAAAGELRRLVSETVDFVEARFPDLDTPKVRSLLSG